MMSAHESLQIKTYEEKIQQISLWKAMSDKEKKVFKKGKFKRRLPITAAHIPNRYLGAVCERIQEVPKKLIMFDGWPGRCFGQKILSYYLIRYIKQNN
jgi:hypothetical protein